MTESEIEKKAKEMFDHADPTGGKTEWEELPEYIRDMWLNMAENKLASNV